MLFAEIHGDIDWSRGYEFLDKELTKIMPESERGRGTVDKLVKVWLPSGEESWLLLHIEVQSQEERDFALRMFTYNYRIFDRYNREVVSVAVLGDERATWRPGCYESRRWGCRKCFEFPAAKLLDWLPRADELEASDNPMATVVLAHLRAIETRNDAEACRAWKFRLVRNLYQRGLDAPRVRQLFRLIDWLMMLPPELETLFQEDFQRMEEENQMPYVTSIERLAREEGQIAGLRMGIESMLKMRLGNDGLKLRSELESIKDLDVLQAILVAMDKVTNLEEARRSIQEHVGKSK